MQGYPASARRAQKKRTRQKLTATPEAHLLPGHPLHTDPTFRTEQLPPWGSSPSVGDDA